ncbi:beta-lactamase domain-containing protein [Methanofollis liminatans DSM 4140]|uniref:Beta-lactamase domain-containing protein n=1 Tax=Methanofollis liminatans DSM 4140 TaxID=28892 RepID=J0RYB6_9EURY|nr:MBL fold metallo-hydrolase [Methanofollis liminatans]EJG06541.1 beta-lactamase domain-containing protein [Methanofollis liminatans DSM 4140]
MKITSLASGSKGNCIYVEGDEGALLIDAGLTAKEIKKRLSDAGCDEGRIRGILVTHEHIDHIRGVDVLARRLGVPVVGTAGTLGAFSSARTSSKPVDLIRAFPGDALDLGGFSITPFLTAHDAAEPCGYRLADGDVSLGCCLDTGIVTPGIERVLARCDAVVLESNHCPQMLEEGPYPEFLKKRIRSKHGHLSNAAAATCLKDIGGGLTAVILAHLSEVNNTRDKALHSAEDGLGLFLDGIDLVVGVQDRISATVRI